MVANAEMKDLIKETAKKWGRSLGNPFRAQLLNKTLDKQDFDTPVYQQNTCKARDGKHSKVSGKSNE